MIKITCSNCNTENPPTGRFCKQCGGQLPVNQEVVEPISNELSDGLQACSKCGHLNPPEATHCEQCKLNLQVTWDPDAWDAEASRKLAQQRRMKVSPRSQFEEAEYAKENFGFSSRKKTSFSTIQLEIDSRYGTLRTIVAICRAIGYLLGGLSIFLGLIGALISLSDSLLTAVAILFATVITGVVLFIFWTIIAEGISVILDIEENTRRTSTLLYHIER